VQAVNARELSDELFEQLCTPEFRLENTSTAVTDKTYHGAAGVREWISDFFDAFDPDARHEMASATGYLNRHDALSAVGVEAPS